MNNTYKWLFGAISAVIIFYCGYYLHSRIAPVRFKMYPAEQVKIDTSAILKPYMAYMDSALLYKIKCQELMTINAELESENYNRRITINNLLTEINETTQIDSASNYNLYSRIQDFISTRNNSQK